MKERVILHCDCNSFFASVETALNPEYKNVPMAVCGDPEDRHGIVLAKNELAKRYGIKTAETVYSAKRACPGLVIAKPHYEEYSKYSRRVNSIYSEYTDLVEPFGIDESWLDVTASGRVFGSGERIAEEIRRRVREEVGITVSIGVSFNKVFAKLGSDYKKPDAVTVINRANYRSIVYPLPVGDMLFVGKRSQETLLSLGIRTIGELAAAPVSLLVNKLGKSGEMLSLYARGLDESPVCVPGVDDVKSIGNGFTFKHDLVTECEARVGIEYLADEIGRRLRRKGMVATTVSLSIKDEYMRVIQRQRPLSVPSDISREIADLAFLILKDEWKAGKPIRTITVTAQGLIKRSNCAEQIGMFEVLDRRDREKDRKKEETVNIIRQKYGAGSIMSGAVMETDIGVAPSKTSKSDA